MTENIYKLKMPVNVNSVGFDGRMSVADTMAMFQFAVTLHTEAMGVGYSDVLREHDAKWVIAKSRFEISRLPKNGEMLDVITWPLKPGMLRFGRCFELKNGSESCVRAYTDWCIINADSFEIQKSALLGELFPEYLTEKPVGKYSNFSLKLSEEDFCYKRKMRLSDLDLNRHVNNISYIKTVLDCFSSSQMSALDIRSFEMNYKRQCFEGETLSLYCKGDGDGYYAEARNDGGETVFSATVNK